MHPHISKLHDIATGPVRLIIGLMSGTSLDGLDIALCRIRGAGLASKVELLNFTTVPYGKNYKDRIQAVFAKQTVDLQQVCVLNPWVGNLHADMILDTLEKWEITPDAVDLIASHGQTIFHAPKARHGFEGYGDATLQIGDGDHMAVRTGIITLSDFRQKHIAAGGEGAPLAVYGDYLIFSDSAENRIMLNMGGIANLTYLPASMEANAVFSSDVGPGNTLMDVYVQHHFADRGFDTNAEIASAGTVSVTLLHALTDHAFFNQPMPKTTGPELFNLDYLAKAQSRSDTGSLQPHDVMATLNRFSADMVVKALKDCGERLGNYHIYASGGGTHNPLLMENIRTRLAGIKISSTAELGIDPDIKEAVLFALLANECVHSSRSALGNSREGIPAVTMGKISFPA